MEAKAQARFARVTPQKARRVVDIIRGKQADEAISVLQYAPQSAAVTVRKIVESAIANARVKADQESVPFNEADMVISRVFEVGRAAGRDGVGIGGGERTVVGESKRRSDKLSEHTR